MSDLLQHVRIDLREVPHVLVARIALADAQDLLIAKPLIGHLQQPNRTNLHHAARKAWRIDQHQRVQRVAIFAKRARDEAIVPGVVNRRVEIAVQAKDVELFVVLILVDSLVRNLDDRIDHLGALGSDG